MISKIRQYVETPLTGRHVRVARRCVPAQHARGVAAAGTAPHGRGRALATGARPSRPRCALALAVSVLALVVAGGAAGPAPAPAGATAADWPTNRGNLQRTGSLDDLPGPKTPALLWTYKVPGHFIASPVPGAGVVYMSGLGLFNTGTLQAFSVADRPTERLLWSKSAPFIKRPVVCAPAVAGSLLVFGDGMHQTDGAVLYCLEADSGLPLWQFPVPGKLIHLEGSPTIADDRVFIGAGEGGVLCLALRQTLLDGKELDLARARTLLETRWKQLAARYEEDKRKDASLAVPPSEEALPKPAPRKLWQKGQGAWHVDAPVAVAGDRVIVASAYIDEEKVGKRVLACCRAADGAVLWETPLKVNPWAGPAVAGNLVIVGCSNIRFDAKQIKDARGEVVAVDLAAGQVKWRRDVPGGILSPVAVKNDLAVFTATDGKIRAWRAADGAEQWTYAAAAPFFAGPAISGGTVYAADLKTVVHAVNLADGKKQWTLDVIADPSVQVPLQVFGSPIVQGGRIYLGTCNLEADAAKQPSAVICLADKSLATHAAAAGLVVDKKGRTVTLPCKIAPRKLATLKEIYPLEVVACYPAPQGAKAHETVVTFDVKPSDVHKALESLGLKPGEPARGEEGEASGPQVNLFLELPGILDKPRVIPLEKTMIDTRTGKGMPPLKWIFTGSVLRQPDPDKPAKAYGADLGGTLVTIFPVTDETVFQTDLSMKDCRLLKLETNKNIVPQEGTAAKLIIQAK
jgi:outer membrane protein assembly factor BamB